MASSHLKFPRNPEKPRLRVTGEGGEGVGVGAGAGADFDSPTHFFVSVQDDAVPYQHFAPPQPRQLVESHQCQVSHDASAQQEDLHVSWSAISGCFVKPSHFMPSKVLKPSHCDEDETTTTEADNNTCFMSQFAGR